MATVVLGCDTNSNDKKFQNAVASVLEKAGYDVEKLTIGPNYFAKYSYGQGGKNPKGKIGIYLIAAGTYSIADFYYGAAKNNNSFKYAYFGIRGDLSVRPHNQSEFESAKIGADADCPASLCAHIKGLTFPEMNNKLKSKCQIVFGKTGEEMGKAIVNAMGGSTSSSSSKKSSASPIRSCIQELLYPWNGDVECFIRDDTVHIRRIPNPTSAKLKLIEGENVLFESISVTDIDPKTPNKLVINWGKSQFTIEDKERIDRFGVIKKTIKSTNKTESSAIAFAYREWNKLLKDDGRVLECKVDGDSKWRIGEWVRVYIPSFGLNGYMYITRTSHDDSGDWDTNLTLLDYPPDLGTEPTQTKTDDSSSSGDDS